MNCNIAVAVPEGAALGHNGMVQTLNFRRARYQVSASASLGGRISLSMDTTSLRLEKRARPAAIRATSPLYMFS